jgi:hypothetical protein
MADHIGQKGRTMKKDAKEKRGGRRLALYVVAGLSMVALSAGTVTTQAGNDIVKEWNFFTSCFDLMINNTPQQVRDCDPKVRNIVTNNPSLSEQSSGGVLVPKSSTPSSYDPP